MRLHHHSGRTVHLSHGVNLRPARSVAGVIDQLDDHAVTVRDRLGVDRLGLSLWLPPDLAAALASDGRSRTRLRAELDARALEVVTLSGVPYASGDDRAAADDHLPDWSSAARLEYTLDLARVLVDLLPDDAVRGAVTTTGFGRRLGWDDAKDKAAGRILGRLSAGLAEVAWQTGRAVRVGFQPEPGCVVDTVDDVLTRIGPLDGDRLGVCLDLANLACTWEEPARFLDRLTEARIRVVRVQVAAAIEVADPAAAAETLRGYVQPGHRHQVTNPAGGYVDDLATALGEFPPGPWRVRYHVPLRTPPAAPLAATTDVWRAALRHLVSGSVAGTEYLDVDTATWDLLPPGARPDGAAALADAVAAELAYVTTELTDLGLVPSAEACVTR